MFRRRETRKQCAARIAAHATVFADEQTGQLVYIRGDGWYVDTGWATFDLPAWEQSDDEPWVRCRQHLKTAGFNPHPLLVEAVLAFASHQLTATFQTDAANERENH